MWEALVSTEYTWPVQQPLMGVALLASASPQLGVALCCRSCASRCLLCRSCASLQEVLAELLLAKRLAAEAHLLVLAADA